MILKALSIRQPWAGFVLTGKKPVENRAWADAYNGPLLIHAPKTFHDGCPQEYYLRAGVNHLYGRIQLGLDDDPRFACGAIVGIAMKGPCVRSGDDPPPTFWHDPGEVWWPLRDAVPLLEPIPYSGQRGLFAVKLTGKERLDHPDFRTIERYVNSNTKGDWIQ